MKQKSILSEDELIMLVNNTTEWRREKGKNVKIKKLVRATEKLVIEKIEKEIDEFLLNIAGEIKKEKEWKIRTKLREYLEKFESYKQSLFQEK